MRCCGCTPAGASVSAVTLSLLTAVTGLLVAFPLHDFVAEKIRAGVRAYAVLDSADAGVYKGWADSRDPSAGQVTSRYWLNNLTNPDEVLRGAKPNLVEIGPLVYNYINTKHDIQWEADGAEVTYREYARYIAADAATLALEQLPITTLNVILLAALREPALIMDELPSVFPATKAHSYWFPRLPARDIIWGYTDSVLGQHFPGMQQNDTSFDYAMAQHSRHRLATGKYDAGRGMEYLEWNGNSELLCCAVGPAGEANAGAPCAPIWHGYDASGFRGSFGTAFHTFIDPGETLQIATYPFGIYRHWPLVCGNVGSGPGAGTLSDGTALTAAIGGCDGYTVQDVHVLRFALPAWVMGNASVDAVEAAAYNISGPSGVLNVTACEQNAPILLSRPHFLSASPALAAGVTGLAPADPALHDSWLGIEPLTGQTIDFQFRVQINAVVQPVTARPLLAAPVTYFQGLEGPLVFPIGWGEQQSSATPFQGSLVTGMIYVPLRAAAALHWGGIATAAAALAVGFVFAARAVGYCGGARVALGGGGGDELELGRRGDRGAALLDSAHETEDFYKGFKSGALN